MQPKDKNVRPDSEIKQLRDFDSFFELLDYFDTEEKCVSYLATLRWNGKPECPYCAHNENIYLLKGKNKRWKCSACRKQFSVRIGTIFEESKLPLRKWFFAIYLATAHKKGISSHQLARDLKITQKAAWFVLHRIRHAFAPDLPQFTEPVEIDESFIGGKEKNKHYDKRTEGTQGRSVKTKVPVLGMLERGGKIYATPITDTSKQSILPIIHSTVKEGNTIYTDELVTYRSLKDKYQHHIVNHSANEYVKGSVSTNSIESFWALLKRGLTGIYHNVSPEHLPKYINEFTFRFNNRLLTDGSRFDVLLANVNNKRLPYAVLITNKKKDTGIQN